MSLPATAADIYRYRDTRGVLHFSNAPTGAHYRFYLRGTAKTMILRSKPARTVDRRAFDAIIHDAARRHRVESALVKAVIQAESDFAPEAVSPKGALGLMQLMPETARRHKVGRVFEPRDNVEGGVTHLRYLLDRYRGDVRLALAAYNAGEKAVDTHRGVPPYAETQEYLTRVLRFRESYLRTP